MAITDFDLLTDATGYRAQAVLGKWIPTNERLPDRRGYFLISRRKLIKPISVARFIREESKWMSAEAQCFYEGVDAWMPLPDAYITQDEEAPP